MDVPLQGIGEKRASYILELREESSEPFKNVITFSISFDSTSKLHFFFLMVTCIDQN